MKTKKNLTLEERQVRFIPLVLAALVAVFYGVIDLQVGGPFLTEQLFGWEY